MNLEHVDGTQDEEAMLELSKLEEPLHFKTTSTGIVVGHDVQDYPNVPLYWYRTQRRPFPFVFYHLVARSGRGS